MHSVPIVTKRGERGKGPLIYTETCIAHIYGYVTHNIGIYPTSPTSPYYIYMYYICLLLYTYMVTAGGKK